MKLLILLLIPIVSSCTKIEGSHDYFLSCEEKFSDFKRLSSCALKEIAKDCNDRQDCNLQNERFVKIIKKLELMVNNNEISDNEAMFRYLNLMDFEMSKIEFYRNRGFNDYYHSNYINDYYTRRMLPLYFRNKFY